MALLRSIAVSMSAIFAAFSFLVLLVFFYEYWWKKTRRSWWFSPKKLRDADSKEDSGLVGSSSSWQWEGGDVLTKLFPEGLLRPRFLFTIEEETKEDIVREDDEVRISFHKASATCSSETVSISVPPPAHISYSISVFGNKKKLKDAKGSEDSSFSTSCTSSFSSTSEDSCCCSSSACCCCMQGDKEGEWSANTSVAGSPSTQFNTPLGSPEGLSPNVSVSVISSCSSEENSGDSSARAPFRETVCDKYVNILQALAREGPFFPRHFSWSGSESFHRLNNGEKLSPPFYTPPSTPSDSRVFPFSRVRLSL